MGMEQKKAATKNQHYVPQFYQRNFSSDGKTIGTYLLDQKKYIPSAAIKHQSSADYFYSPNMKIEEALGALEKLASVAINKVIDNPKVKLPQNDAVALYVFTMLQIGRTPAFVKKMEENANKMGMMMLRKYIEAMRKTDRAEEVEDLTDDVLDAVSLKLNQPGKFAVSTIASMMDTCMDLVPNAKILINQTKTSFITSDNPACLYDQHFERIGNVDYALGSCGLQMYLPITPSLAILYYDSDCYKLGDRKKHYVELTQGQDVHQLNRLVACTADEVLYCENGKSNLSDLENYSNAHDKFHLDETVQTFETAKTETSEIIGAHEVSMFCKLKLSFVKELPLYKAKTDQNFDYNKDRFRKSVYLLDRYRKRR